MTRRSLEGIRRIVDHCRRSADESSESVWSSPVDKWRSSLLKKSGWYYGSSDSRGSSERHRARSEAGRTQEGSAFYELQLGVFYTQHQSPSFRVWIPNEVQKNSHSRSYPPRFSHSMVFRYFGIWRIGAGAFSNRDDPKRFFRNSHWSAALDTTQ